MKRALWMAMFALALALVPARAEEAAEKQVLPGDAIVHVQIGPIQPAIEGLESYILSASRGTGLPLPLQPGMAMMMLPQLTNLPPGALDENGYAHVLVDGRGKAGLVLPVKDLQTHIASLKGMGVAQEQPDGTLLMTNPQNGRSLYLVPLEKQLVESDTAKTALAVASLVKAWDTMQVKTESPIVVTVDVAKIVETNSAKLDEIEAQILEEISEREEEEGQPFTKEALEKQAPVIAKWVRDLLGQLRSVRAYMRPSVDTLGLTGYCTPKAETQLAALAKAYADEKAPEYELMKYLPRDPLLVEAVNYPAGVLEAVQPLVMPLLESLAALPKEGNAQQFVKDVAAMMAVSAGRMSLGMYLDQDTTTQQVVGYYQIEKPEEFQKQFGGMMTSTVDFLDAFLGMLDVPMEYDFEYVAEAGQVEGVSYSQLKVDMKAKPDGEMPPQAAEHLKKVLGGMNQYYATVDGVWIMVSGHAAEQQLGKAITALRQKTVGLGQQQEVMQTLQATKTRSAGFVLINPLEFVRMQMLQMYAMMPGDHKQAVEVFKKMQAEVPPLSFGVGGQASDGNDDQPEQYSLKWTGNIPAASIAETVKAVRTAQMQAGPMFPPMQEEGNMDATPPEPAPGLEENAGEF